MHRPFFVNAEQLDARALLGEWQWLVPATETPLFLTAMGDWVFGASDGSLWLLSMLEGAYTKIAEDSGEFNRLNKSQEWIEETFLSGWFEIGAGNGIQPGQDECLGWKLHPSLGGQFAATNLKVFSMAVYQSLMGQLHCQLQRGPADAHGRIREQAMQEHNARQP
ncbi:T6SS immunity protein Tdi1 domain-containing protein [Pseudoduganella violaceinigra]|uniref:T6SS immunity protein Tdi1 domain-containing protein n=1 Tax=Pseudoduganella violaceinigra TaxID=246602 RepID=UPI001B7FE9D3|nr:T6SS immunity protein Tdi1 domain-containing protein [Pseudoduganella violaceinigra]